jgi:hypothetical protein
MRIPTVAAFTAFGSLIAVGSAGADTWCYRDFGDAKPGYCSFYSGRQCLEFARIAGGICEREQAALERPAPKAKVGKKAAR